MCLAPRLWHSYWNLAITESSKPPATHTPSSRADPTEAAREPADPRPMHTLKAFALIAAASRISASSDSLFLHRICDTFQSSDVWVPPPLAADVSLEQASR